MTKIKCSTSISKFNKTSQINYVKDKKPYVMELARVQDFTFYHAEPECIAHFFPENKTNNDKKYGYGILVMTSPGNSPE